MATDVYFAGALTDPAALRAGGATHALVSYVEIRDNVARLDALDGFKLFLDCGAWSVASGKTRPITTAEYHAFVKEHRDRFELVAALDVIGDPVATERNYMEALDDGLNLVPTWHAEEPPLLARRYAERAPYVAIGGLASRYRTGAVDAFIAPAWPHVQHRRVHLFGVGTGLVVAKFRPTSIDFTTWLIGGQFGAVFSIQWPVLRQVVVRPKTGSFRRDTTLALTSEMRRYGFRWADFVVDGGAGGTVRNRYNVMLMLDYMRRIDAVGGTTP